MSQNYTGKHEEKETRAQERERKLEEKEHKGDKAFGQQAPEVAPMAITPGATVAGTTTLAALTTLVYGTLSSDLITPVWTWTQANVPYTLVCTFSGATTPTGQASKIYIRFEAAPALPQSIAP